MAGGRRYRKTMTHREVFFAANGFGPWICHACKEPVSRGELDVHHVDGNHDNDDPSNLAATHMPCHMKLHFKGRSWQRRGPMSDEHRARISTSLKRAYAEGRKKGWADGGGRHVGHRAH